ncbi:tetratricopeptide repeat protein [Candidatus Woesebacteria bacterium]|nr:tetratricopeptide repeat protein [Candidatus Woesebacteria bacterium]
MQHTSTSNDAPARGEANEGRENDSWFSRTITPLSEIYMYVGISLFGFLLYARTLFFDFTYFDDNVLVLDNLPFLQDWHNIFTTFTREVFHVLHGSAAYYRPLLTLSFMPDAIIGGASPAMYHFTNIIIHLIASCLLYALFRKLKYTKDIAIFSALIFVVHPVLTQAVAWVPGRNDSLLALFVLASFITLIQYTETKRFVFAILSIFFFGCAIFTKETALVIPVVFFIYLYAKKVLNRSTVLKFGGGFTIVGLLWAILRHFALKNPIPMSPSEMVQSVWNNTPASLQLLGKAFFPLNLSVLPIIQDTTFVWGAVALTIIVGLLVIEFVFYEKSRQENLLMMFFGAIWFCTFLFPSFIRPNPTAVADFIEHRLYLPIIGIMIFVIESRISTLLSRIQDDFIHAGLTIIILVFTFLTLVHASNFSNKLSFWKNAAETSPHSPLAQRNLGAMYYLDKEHDLAEEYFKKSLLLNKNEQMAHNNLGLLYMNRGEFREAEREYKEELLINPDYDNAYFNLGLLYYQTGKVEEAQKLWQRTLEINPEYEDARKALERAQNK